jgi:hypothetical protein
VFGIDAIFFAAEVTKCDRWLRCHAVIFAVALFLRTFYDITQFQKLQDCVDLNREFSIKTKQTGFLGVSALEIYHNTSHHKDVMTT